MKSIRCFLLPSSCDQSPIGPNAVVIDVLRASTTICHALFHGAKSIQPFVGVEQARDFAAGQPGILVGGERQGKKLPGFDLGNSPLEYSKASVAGRRIAFTTTNGTQAMEQCKSCQQVAVASFCNLSAMAQFFQEQQQLDLICAGTNGKLSTEDCAFAGAVVEKFEELGSCIINQDGKKCFQYWQEAKHNLAEYLRSGLGGQNLLHLGRGNDIDFAAQLDSLPIVPLLDVKTWVIEPA